MPRDASLFEKAKGSVLKGYLLLSKESANIPPMWIDRARQTRKSKQSLLTEILKKRISMGMKL